MVTQSRDCGDAGFASRARKAKPGLKQAGLLFCRSTKTGEGLRKKKLLGTLGDFGGLGDPLDGMENHVIQGRGLLGMWADGDDLALAKGG